MLSLGRSFGESRGEKVESNGDLDGLGGVRVHQKSWLKSLALRAAYLRTLRLCGTRTFR